MNTKFVFKSILSAAIFAVLFISCDKDYNDFGTDIIGGNHYDFERDTTSSVIAYNVKTGYVQTNNIATGGLTNPVTVNSLGIYNNRVFGKTKANFVTQLELKSVTPTFGTNLVMDSVYLNVPYFSKKTATASDGKGTYELDSIYGNSKIKLSVFESGYFINDLDPDANLEETAKYYNNDVNFENYRKGALEDGSSVFNGPRLNNSTKTEQNDEFAFSDKEIVTTTTNDEDVKKVTRSAPAMRLSLNKNFFKKKIVDASSEKLNTQANFKNYFRGLYFKVEETEADKGSLASLNFTAGTVTLYYTEDLVKNNVTTRVQKTFVLNLAGNRISILEETNNGTNADYLSATNNSVPDTETGDETLFIKGGEGSLAVIDLFGADLHGDDGLTGAPNEVPDELDIIRKKKWLINEANLTFYVDTTKMAGVPPPQRIYLYDLTNNIPLFDYTYDGTTSSSSVKRNRQVYGGILQKKTINNIEYSFYKIRLTRHLNNLIKNNVDNVRLGLVVIESINDSRNLRLKQAIDLGTEKKLDRIPLASVLNPLGTVLFGNSTDPEANKITKLKLEIFYTNPN